MKILSYFIYGSDKMYEIYTVLERDTFEKIADQYGTTVGTLFQINGLESNYSLVPGSQLVVPVGYKQPYQYYTVKKGDNMYDIANDNNIDYHLLLQLNGLEPDDYIYPNQTIMLPKKGLKVYLTREDDTLSDVLRRLMVSLDELVSENNKIYLRPEQILVFKEK